MTDTSKELVDFLADKCATSAEEFRYKHRSARRILIEASKTLRALLARAEAAEAERDASKAEAERLREALGTISLGVVPQSKPFTQWHDRYQDLRAFASAALQENSHD